MRRIINSIPNTITSLNLLCGTVAIVKGFEGDMQTAFFFIIGALVFDFFDGFAARALNAYSPMGKELDSLADVVSFGVAPAVMLFSLSGGNYFAFVLTVFSALRLAKFNIDTRQSVSFIGLPTPACAIFFCCGAFLAQSGGLYDVIFSSQAGLIISVIVFSLLLVSEIPMFSLKLKSYKIKDNITVYTFLLLSVVAIALFQFSAVPPIIIGYILLSAIKAVIVKNGECKKN